jgi:hypothetical protein
VSKRVMTKTSCEDVRRQLDEVKLGDECSAAIREHLRGCSACSEFDHKQTKLRQIVGSLGTVEAPPDFDFRLRARLANESAGNGAFHFRAGYWSFTRSAATAVAALLLFVGGYLVVRQFTQASKTVETPQVVKNDERPGDKQTVQVLPELPSAGTDDQLTPVAVNNDSEKPTRRNRISQRSKRSIVSTDYSSQGAPVINTNPTVVNDSPVFPIDASQQSFRFSLDDGRGNERTISLPRVTFGSQRVLATGNQFAPKGVW